MLGERAILMGFKSRLVMLSVATVLIAGSVVVRLWLAATNSYSTSGSVPIRVASSVSLAVGVILSIVMLVWPMPTQPKDKKGGDSR